MTNEWPTNEEEDTFIDERELYGIVIKNKRQPSQKTIARVARAKQLLQSANIVPGCIVRVIYEKDFKEKTWHKAQGILKETNFLILKIFSNGLRLWRLVPRVSAHTTFPLLLTIEGNETLPITLLHKPLQGFAHYRYAYILEVKAERTESVGCTTWYKGVKPCLAPQECYENEYGEFWNLAVVRHITSK